MVVQDMIPVNQAALKLGISREVAVRLIQRHQLPGSLVAGRWPVEPSAAERYLSSRLEGREQSGGSSEAIAGRNGPGETVINRKQG